MISSINSRRSLLPEIFVTQFLAVFLILNALVLYSNNQFLEITIYNTTSRSTIYIFSAKEVWILFNNSVTGGQVTIVYEKTRDEFVVKEIYTDQGTEEYYTSGLYNLSIEAKKYSQKTIEFCTDLSIRVFVKRDQLNSLLADNEQSMIILNISSACIHIE